MVVAAVVSVTQLTLLGSWARSLRLTTLLQGIAVGFLVCGTLTVTIQFLWTRLVATVFGAGVADLQELASWTVDPVLEEVIKVAPLLWLAWRRPRVQRQLGYTDHLLYGAALGMGFELLEAALRFARPGMIFMRIDGGYVVDGSLAGTVTVPSIWTSLTTWQPVPAGFEDFLSSGGDTIQHLVWTALAGLGVAWLARRRDVLRLLGLVPLLVACLDHANYNLRVQWEPPLQGWWSDALAWVGEQLSWVLVVALVAAVVVDRLIQARARRAAPTVLFPGEPPTGLNPAPVLRVATAGMPWSLWTTWDVVLSRRAAMTAFVAGEQPPHLGAGVAEATARLAQVTALPRSDAAALWSTAWQRVRSSLDLSALRSPRMIVWAIAMVPALLYLVIGAFPATQGVQQAMRSPVGLWVTAVAAAVALVLTATQLKGMLTALRQVVEPSLHERRLRLQARLATAVGALGSAALMLALVLVERDPSASIVRTYHVLDAISDALLILGLALVVGSFFLFPPAGLVAVAGGGAVLVPTVTGAFVTTIGAGAILTSLGILLNEASSNGGGGGGGGSGGNPPRFTSNARQSRTYGSSVSDIQGQASRYAGRMRRDGFDVFVGSVRYGKYGYADVTVTTIRNGVVKHIRHFIYKG